jgi:hypothetical protein
VADRLRRALGKNPTLGAIAIGLDAFLLAMHPSPTNSKNGVHEQEEKDTARPDCEHGGSSKVLEKEPGNDRNIDDHDPIFQAHFQSLYLRAEINEIQFIRRKAKPKKKIVVASQLRLPVTIK